MIFFSKEHKRLFHGPLSEEKHPLSDLSCLGIIILAILTAVFQAESFIPLSYFYTHVTSETSCIVLPLIWLKVRYEVVQKLDYQTCQ